MHGIEHGAGVWRYLMGERLSFANDKRGILRIEPLELTAVAGADGLRPAIVEVEGITDKYECVADKSFDEEYKAHLWKLHLESFMAQPARTANTYRPLVAVVKKRLACCQERRRRR